MVDFDPICRTRKTNGNFGNVSASVLFSNLKSRINENGGKGYGNFTSENSILSGYPVLHGPVSLIVNTKVPVGNTSLILSMVLRIIVNFTVFLNFAILVTLDGPSLQPLE